MQSDTLHVCVARRQVLITHNNRVVLPSVAGSQKPFQHTKLMDDFLLYHIITAPCVPAAECIEGSFGAIGLHLQAIFC